MNTQKLFGIVAIGSIVEIYDFVIYALLASYFAPLFFPEGDMSALLKTLSVFVVSYLARPIGGVCIGLIGDRFGRKFAFNLSIQLMGIATIAIALLPSYHQIGILSTILLCTFRLLQAIAQGAEIAGAMTIVSEHTHASALNGRLSLLFACISIGGIFASSVCFILTHFLNHQEMCLYGWRIAFAMGGLLSIIGIYSRRYFKESDWPVSSSSLNWLKYFQEIVLTHKKSLMFGALICALPASVIVFSHFLPSLLIQSNYASPQIIYGYRTIAMVWYALLTPCIGICIDKHFSNQHVLKWASLSTILWSSLVWRTLQFNHDVVIFFTFITYNTFQAILVSTFPSLFASLFPKHIRFTSIAFSYNICLSLTSATIMLSTFLIPYDLLTNALLFIIPCTSMITYLASSRYCKTKHLIIN